MLRWYPVHRLQYSTWVDKKHSVHTYINWMATEGVQHRMWGLRRTVWYGDIQNKLLMPENDVPSTDGFKSNHSIVSLTLASNVTSNWRGENLKKRSGYTATAAAAVWRHLSDDERRGTLVNCPWGRSLNPQNVKTWVCDITKPFKRFRYESALILTPA